MIDEFINSFDIDVKSQKYRKTILNSKEIDFPCYKQYYPDYYKIIEDCFFTEKIL